MTATVTVTGAGAISGYGDLRLLESLTRAAGELFNDVAGRIVTRLVSAFTAGDTSAVVESTYGFPEAGTLWLGGVGFTYTSTTDGSFDGLATILTVNLESFDIGTEIVNDVSALTPADTEDPDVWVPQLDLAFRDTIPMLTTGTTALDKARTLWGLPIPADDPETRGGFAVACYAPRDRRQTLMQFLRAVLADRETAVTVTQATGTPQRITGPASTFSLDMVGRWVYLASQGASTATDGYYEIREYISDTAVELNHIASVRYGLKSASWSANNTSTAYLLGWSLEENPQVPCSINVRIWEFGGTPVPGDYMQPATSWLLYTIGIGGPLVAGDTVTGLTSGFTATVAQNVVNSPSTGAVQLQDLVGTPINGEVFSGGATPWGAIVNGTVGDQLVRYDGESGGGFAVADTVTGASGGAISTVRGEQDNGTDGYLVVEYDLEASNLAAATSAYYVDNEDLEVSATVRGQAFGDSQTLDRPASQAAWGYITADELVDGSTRRPLYLAGGSVDAELQACLDYMVAAGVWARVLIGGWVG